MSILECLAEGNIETDPVVPAPATVDARASLGDVAFTPPDLELSSPLGEVILAGETGRPTENAKNMPPLIKTTLV